MHSNCDIFITFSKYLIRPQQRRIFAIICNNSADDIIAHCANKKLAEYCNSLRKHRDISGKVIRYYYKLPYQTIYIRVKYYDITGYSYEQCIKPDSNIYNFYHREIRFSLYINVIYDLDRIIFHYIGNNEGIVIHRKYSKPEILSYSYKKYNTIYQSEYSVNPILYCEYNWYHDSNILTISNELWSCINPKQFFIKN